MCVHLLDPDDDHTADAPWLGCNEADATSECPEETTLHTRSCTEINALWKYLWPEGVSMLGWLMAPRTPHECAWVHDAQSVNGDPCPGGGDAASAAAPFCSGHGTCDGSGTNAGTGVCTCAKGWGTDDCSVCAKGMGPPGKCDTPVCTESCVNGKCTAPDTCACAQGWKGSTCDAPICFPQSGNGGTGTGGCGANGKCVAPDTCSCASGWSGKDCSTPVCDEVKCSAAHGTCSAPNACTCAKGWQGATCDQAICETACGAHGKCTAPDACTCAKGWRGDQCDEAVCTQ